MLWQSSAARRFFKRDKTGNPTPAASALLGLRGKRARRVAAAYARKTGRRRPFFKGNPLPAAISSLGLGALKGVFGRRFDPAKHKQRIQGLENLAAVVLDAGPGSARGKAALAQIEAQANMLPTAPFATYRELADYAKALLVQLAVHVPTTAAPITPPATALSQLTGFLGTPGGAQVIRTAVSAAKPKRQRYPTYVDRYGRQRYSTKPPGSQYRLPAGATPIPGSPYNFFTGAVGKGGALATAGQVAVAGAAGIGAYLVTQRVLQHLGGKAQSAEEAGVNAALAFRQARADFKASQGRDPNRAELAAMGDAYKAKLVELGYDPVTFRRERSGFESFLETYNPFGG